MKISASIYSSSNKNIEENIKILDELNIDMIHIDFNDNCWNSTFNHRFFT